MGREIKRVPLDFDHPRGETWRGYLREKPCESCSPGKREDCDDCCGDAWVSDPIEPPDGPGWQVWETVSEGSAVSPVFASAEELARHLSTVGDDWAVKSREAGGPNVRRLPTYEQALAFVMDGWAPTAVFTIRGGA